MPAAFDHVWGFTRERGKTGGRRCVIETGNRAVASGLWHLVDFEEGEANAEHSRAQSPLTGLQVAAGSTGGFQRWLQATASSASAISRSDGGADVKTWA